MSEVERLEAEIKEVRALCPPAYLALALAKRDDRNGSNGQLASAQAKVRGLTERLRLLRFCLAQARQFEPAVEET